MSVAVQKWCCFVLSDLKCADKVYIEPSSIFLCKERQTYVTVYSSGCLSFFDSFATNIFFMQIVPLEATPTFFIFISSHYCSDLVDLRIT